MRELTSPPAIVAQAEAGLEALASKANAQFDAARRTAGESLAFYRGCGQTLNELKKRVGHGNWLAFQRENLRMGERWAQRCMALDKSDVTSDSPLEEQEEEWRRISGNAPAPVADEDDGEVMPAEDEAEWTAD